MFIPEKINLSDSLLFMLSCREALAGIVEQSSMPLGQKGRTHDFLFNEASDYQIMSLILKGELPKNKYNAIAEQDLHLELKKLVLFSTPFIGEQFGEEVLESVLFEIGPLYPNYSSAVPIVEFLTSTKSKLVVEAPAAEVIGGAAEKVSAVWNKFMAIPAVKAALADVKPGSAMRDSEVKKLVMKQLEKAGGKVDQAVQGLKSQYDSGFLKSRLDKINKVMDKGEGRFAPRSIDSWWDKLQSRVRVRASGAKNAIDSAIKQAHEFSAQNPNAKYIAGAALAALAIYAGYKTYKRFFSQAAKACAGNKGPERKACLSKYKIQAIKAQISDLQAASAKCSVSKDPGKCKAAIGNKIQKLQAKAQKASA